MEISNDGYLTRYTYDANGQRAIRSHGPVEAVYVNGAPQGINYHDEENYTLYISPYATMTSDRFTKHYYAGTRRIASKLGIGEFDNIYGVNNKHLTAGNKDYTERMMQIETGRQHHYRDNGIPPGVPTQKGQTGEPEILGTALPNVPLGNYDVPDGWPTPPHFNQPGDVPGPPVQLEDPEDELAEPGYGYVADTTAERDIYYFHSDHLGSTAYLTDRNGEVTQFVVYMPYGETLVDEHTTTYENPFKFSGKELDDITGLYDHGARSRDPRVTMWLNIDPLFEKYPDYSPYNYCAGNPVKLVDLDGRDWYSYNDEENHVIKYQWKAGKAESIDVDGKTYRNIGAVYTSKRYYLGLFGDKAVLNTNRAKMLEAIDKAIISYAHDKEDDINLLKGLTFSSEQVDYTSTIYTGVRVKNNSILVDEAAFSFQYAKNLGKGVFHNFSDKKTCRGQFTSFPTHRERRTNVAGPDSEGFFLTFKNNRGGQDGLDVVNIRFQNQERATQFIKIFNKQFPKASFKGR